MCLCINTFGVGLSSDSLNINVYFQDSRSFIDSFIDIYDEHLYFNQHLDSYEINRKEYFDILEYTGYNPEKTVNYKTVIIAKSIGIIAILESDEEWIIIDDSNREIEV